VRATSFNECTAEVAEVIAEGQKARTIAVELEDVERGPATLREPGVSDRENTSCPRWLKTAVGTDV
jgi:hypothetical protein